MPKLKEYKMFINGEWVDSESKKTFETLNPENNEPWAKVPEANAKDVDKAVNALTALSTSLAFASGTLAQGSLFSGFKVSNVFLLSESTHSPLINILYSLSFGIAINKFFNC